MTSGGPDFGSLQWRLVTLPIKEGGLGVFSAADISKFSFLASRIQSNGLQNHILRKRPCGMGKLFDMAIERWMGVCPLFDVTRLVCENAAPQKTMKTLAGVFFTNLSGMLLQDPSLLPRQSAVLQCIRSPHAQDFLKVVPIQGLGQ